MPRTGGTGGTSLPFPLFALFLNAKINPYIWEAIATDAPKYSKDTLDMLCAQIISSVADSLQQKKIQGQLNKLGIELYTAAVGNTRIPGPAINNLFFNGDVAALNPQPLPPGNKYYGAILCLVAHTMSDLKIASKVESIGEQLMQRKK